MKLGGGAQITTTAQIGDGVIVDADINASAAIAFSKLASDPLARANHTGTQTKSTVSDYPAAASQAEMEAGTEVAAREMNPAGVKQAIVALGASGPLIVANPTEITVSNSAAENTLFSVSIPANTLLTGKAIRFKAYFSAFTITGNYKCDFKIKYGVTTIVTLTTPETAHLGVRKGWLEGIIMADGGSSAQKGAATLFFAVDGEEAAADAAVGYSKNSVSALGSGAEVATGALNLVLSAQFNNASVNENLTAEFWLVEKVA